MGMPLQQFFWVLLAFFLRILTHQRLHSFLSSLFSTCQHPHFLKHILSTVTFLFSILFFRFCSFKLQYIYNFWGGVLHCLLLLCFHVSFFMCMFVASSNALSILLYSSTLNSLFQFSCSLCWFFFFFFLWFCWPCLPRQRYCVQIHYRIQYLNGFWFLGNRLIFIGGFLKDDILTYVET